MYSGLDSFESALKHFGSRVELICAMELSGRIDAETAYQNIKLELKSLKQTRKDWKKMKVELISVTPDAEKHIAYCFRE